MQYRSNARVPYTSHQYRPLIAGHRGMAGILPENTKEAFLASLYEGSDFVELDVVLTKDNHVLVAHDTYLSRISNIQEFPEFLGRKQKRFLNEKEQDDWWVCDFTVSELKQLGIKQTLHKDRLQIFDFKFTFPTLEEVIQVVKEFNRGSQGSRNPDQKLAGILLEIKNRDFHNTYTTTNISNQVHQVLKDNNIDTVELASQICPIVVMSFYDEILKYFLIHSDLPRLYLVSKLQQLSSLDLIKSYADGVGLDIKLLWDKEKDAPSPLVQKIRQKGILLYSWTIQDDNQRRMEWMNAKNSNELHWKLMKILKLDGIITEFPEKAINIVQIFREQNEQDDDVILKSASYSSSSKVSKVVTHARKSSL